MNSICFSLQNIDITTDKAKLPLPDIQVFKEREEQLIKLEKVRQKWKKAVKANQPKGLCEFREVIYKRANRKLFDRSKESAVKPSKKTADKTAMEIDKTAMEIEKTAMEIEKTGTRTANLKLF